MVHVSNKEVAESEHAGIITHQPAQSESAGISERHQEGSESFNTTNEDHYKDLCVETHCIRRQTNEKEARPNAGGGVDCFIIDPTELICISGYAPGHIKQIVRVLSLQLIPRRNWLPDDTYLLFPHKRDR